MRQFSRRIQRAHIPFSAFSLECEPTVFHRRNIVLLSVHFPTFWLPGRILDHLHGILVHACRRRSRSFHVSYFYHPIGQFIILQYWIGSGVNQPFLYSMGVLLCYFLLLGVKMKNKDSYFWHLACVGRIFLLEIVIDIELYRAVERRRWIVILFVYAS